MAFPGGRGGENAGEMAGMLTALRICEGPAPVGTCAL
jgi:hypothetical protein